MITITNETRTKLNESIAASMALAEEAKKAGNAPYAAANEGFADGLKHVLSLAPPCAEGCGGSVDGEGRAHVDCDAPEQGTAGAEDDYGATAL
jgi:hypothetical protein